MQRLEFQRIAIVNRGEAALRLIRAVREINEEQGTRLRAIALYTEPDARSLFVREADEGVALGAPSFIDPHDGRHKSAYHDLPRLERSLLEGRADAAWAGWGFLAEHPEFPDICQRAGIMFAGPGGDVLRRVGDKMAAKRLAAQAGITVVPWSGGAVGSLDEARRHGERLGFPLVIKPVKGHGGRAIRRVHDMAELGDAFDEARTEAKETLGDADVFLERLIEGGRQIEVQIAADQSGEAVSIGVRDCTIQYHQTRVLQEAPSPALTPDQDRQLREAAVRLASALEYRNVGTVEFLYDPRHQTFAFLEVNPGLQGEHPITEVSTGIDLVKLQLRLAAGGALRDEDRTPFTRGHAIQVRVRAEDPQLGFVAAPGVIERLKLPMGPGVRVDVGYDEGDVMPVGFGPTLARIVVAGRDRREAIARLRRTLAEGAFVVRGGTSNQGFLLDLLDRPDLVQGSVDVGWLDRLVARGQHVTQRHANVALVFAAIEAYHDEVAVERANFYTSAAQGRPEVDAAIGRIVELRHLGQLYEFRVLRIETRDYRVEISGRRIDVSVDGLGRSEYRLTCGDDSHRILSSVHGLIHLVEVNGVPHRVHRDRGGIVRTPAPAVVVQVAVEEGDEVAIGDRLAVLEAMKTETELVAPFAGRVRQVMVINNTQVMPGTPLFVIEPPVQRPADAIAPSRVEFDGLGSSEAASVLQPLDELKALILGFDADASRLREEVAERGVLAPDETVDDLELLRKELALVRIFVDLHALFRGQRDEGDVSEDARFSTQEYLLTYLRELGARGEGLPAGFIKKLRGVLSYYGVHDLRGGPELEEALFRVYKSQQRVEEQTAPMLGILQRWIDEHEKLESSLDTEAAGLLDRTIAETQGRFPALNDMAHEVRYRYYDQPVLESARQSVLAKAEAELAYLADQSDVPDRMERIQSLVDCPQPLTPYSFGAAAEAQPMRRRVMLEVLLRRHYRIRSLEGVQVLETPAGWVARAEYDHQGKRIHLLTTACAASALADAAGALLPLVARCPDDDDVVVDFELGSSDPLGESDALCERIGAVLADTGFPRPIRRIVVTIAEQPDCARIEHFTFRPHDDGYREEQLYRGLHPMIGKRLHIWRLSNFSLERLPSAADVYLYRARGRDNPKDERLFALAEVRDLTPVRDGAGRMVRLPQTERMLMESLASLRRVQAHRSPRDRLQWNRVFLFLWPVLDLKPDELNDLIRRLAPATNGLGLECVLVRARVPGKRAGEFSDRVLDIAKRGAGVSVRYREPSTQPMETLSEYTQKVVLLRRRGVLYPYELIEMFTPARDDVQGAYPPGTFEEYDLDENHGLVRVERPYGKNKTNIVVGIIRHFTEKYPEGMARVILLGDPSRGMGSLAEPECRRIIAALDLAEEMKVPLEWFAISAGAKISMDSGVENMDWIALVLRRLIEFTQAGHEVNVVVTGINVGAQPYWNAEATMLMHTRGILIMTAAGSMVLTGKRALDYSGGVSAEDNAGIGGYDRVMGPNGQAQYYAADEHDACQLLLRYYDHSYVAPGERFPRRRATSDPSDRDVQTFPHGRVDGYGFATVGDIFSEEKNAGRKKPFDIRRVMRAAMDQDDEPLERWFGMRDAEVAVVWDACIGGYPVCLLGLESRPLPRLGTIPADGPRQWTAGTLFPGSSKKVARAVNSASGNRPLVILANLSGFDGSPESMRSVQLEYGAEIGRAVVNFEGPIVFCVVSRYHGGAFVVFSNKLNDRMEVAAVEGAFASVIGGAPAAAVVFAREVGKRTREDERIADLQEQLQASMGAEKVRLRLQLREVSKSVYSEKLGDVADEFDRVHNIYRAQKLGSVHHIIPPDRLRPWLIEAIERGMRRELETQS